jgi:hypothetical protein
MPLNIFDRHQNCKDKTLAASSGANELTLVNEILHTIGRFLQAGVPLHISWSGPSPFMLQLEHEPYS